ncbi:MAG: SH3 domain-containing protein [Planctomycetota bacterium]
MFAQRKSELVVFCLVAAVLVSGAVGFAQTEMVAKPEVGLGEVTRNDVYVRSGASLNHYPVCKLRAGDRVRIVSEQGEWFEILPPPGTFSLVSGDFVDTVDDQLGTVNGDEVRVRAGSTLNDQKYTVQAKLSRGTQVKILGRNPDGFVRIEPPVGATVWINRSFIERVSEAQLKLEAQGIETTPGSANIGGVPREGQVADGAKPVPDQATMTGGETEKPKANPSPITKVDKPAAARASLVHEGSTGRLATVGSSLASLPATDQRKALSDLDAAVEAESAKPASERNLDPLIHRFREIANQGDDDFAQRYAKARMDQLQSANEVILTLKSIRELSESTEGKRRQLIEERANQTYKPLPPVLTGFDAQGELRASALYPPGSNPRRYRLIDPSNANGLTLGYIELPSDSPLGVEAYLGQYVGIRASEKRLQIGAVDPVPVYLVREIVRLEPTPGTNTGSSQQ